MTAHFPGLVEILSAEKYRVLTSFMGLMISKFGRENQIEQKGKNRHIDS